MNKHNLFYNAFLLTMLIMLPHCTQSRQTMPTVSQENTVANPKIKLFVYHFCRYCQKVINMLRESKNLDNVIIIDASRPENLKLLKTLNNDNTQCPFLFDEENNVKMLESEDIMQYLKTRFASRL